MTLPLVADLGVRGLRLSIGDDELGDRAKGGNGLLGLSGGLTGINRIDALLDLGMDRRRLLAGISQPYSRIGAQPEYAPDALHLEA
jgi:hypothetical protein